MKKTSMIFSVSALFLAFFLFGGLLVAFQDNPKEIYKEKFKEKITLQSKVFKKPTKPSVIFPHQMHVEKQKVPCTECHHNYKDGKNIWKMGDPVKACDACHTKDGKAPKDVKEKEQVQYLQEAYHVNCRDCHKEMKKKDKTKKPPTTCTKCHIKKKEK